MNDILDFSHIIYNENDNEPSYIDNEPDDSSLRDIYTGQTFTTFEVLETCLKRYAMKTGFEIRIVRCDKENADINMERVHDTIIA
jgi:hypothetical protein